MVWLKRIAIVLAVLAAVCVGGGLLLPSSAHVERSNVINVPQDHVFAMVNSFARFNEWSPWAELDPNTRYEFSGPVAGVGAGMSWASEDAAVGTGSQKILESTAPTLVRVQLEFVGQSGAVAFYRMEALETGTRITWGFDTEFGNDLIGRWFGYLMFDSMIGGDYENGLSKLKTVLEQQPPAPSPVESPVTDPAIDATPNPEAEPTTATQANS